MKRLLCVALLALAAGSASAQGRKPATKPKPAPAPTPKPAPTERPKFVEVTVFEVAGSRAYLQPGAKGAVRRSATITIKGKNYRVAEATESYAVIDLADDSVHEKDKGRASIVEDEEAKPPPPPRPLSTWEHGWTEAPAPASLQEPHFVPIGEANRDRRYDVRVSVASGGLIALPGQAGSNIGFVEVGARVHAEPFPVPAAFDFDGSLRFWAAADLSSRVGGSTRSILSVRELLASYGRGGWFAGLGRMRYAASTLGTLDGLRVQAPIAGGFSIGAFGGFLPNPLGGEISGDAQRFGLEVRFSRPDSSLRPEAAIVAHGSTFGGKPDERRISAIVGLYPGPSRFGAHVEIANFDADNPWKASTVEVTSAGLDQSVRLGKFELGGRFDVLQPERSRWLASYLPTSWFCRTVPTAGTPTSAEPCDGRSSMRALGALNAGVTIGKASLAVGATAMGDLTHSGVDPRVLGGFATGRVVRIARYLRFEASGSYSNATYLSMFGGSAGVGVTLFEDALDVSAYYRRTEIQYAVANTFLGQDRAGGAIVLLPSSTMMFTVQGEGMGGEDSNGIFVFGTALWRPRF